MRPRSITVAEAMAAAGTTPEEMSMRLAALQKHFVTTGVTPAEAILVCISMGVTLGLDGVKQSKMTEAEGIDGLFELVDAFVRIGLRMPSLTKTSAR